MSGFTAAGIPSQAGKLAIVTGANSGLGYDTALELARAGAEVILAARNEAKGLAAAAAIRRQVPAANIAFEKLDLASLASVAAFAARIAETRASLDILVNNAGLMALPKRQTTQDGFEMQFGVNYLGHFALTARLFPLLRNAAERGPAERGAAERGPAARGAAAPRVVQLSSIAHRSGQIDFGDLQGTRYKPWKAYGQSKLAMLIFALELQRRSDAGGWNILSTAAHPGLSRTELIANGPGAKGIMGLGSNLFFSLFGQSSAQGALPTLFGATAPQARPGAYYGPMGFQELKGPAGPARIMKQAQDPATAKRLWEISEQLTGTRFP